MMMVSLAFGLIGLLVLVVNGQQNLQDRHVLGEKWEPRFTGRERSDRNAMECVARVLALHTAPVYPLNHLDLEDALELHKYCKQDELQLLRLDGKFDQSYLSLERRRRLMAEISSNEDCAVYRVGSDQGFEMALEKLRRSNKLCKRIELGPGIHYLNHTIKLTEKDRGLEIRGHLGEDPSWISGGTEIVLTKETMEKSNYKVANGRLLVVKVPGIDRVESLFGVNPHIRFQRARWPNGNSERDQWGYASPMARKVSVPADHVKNWTRPKVGTKPETTFVDLTKTGNPTGFVKADSTMKEYNTFTTGTGGVCSEMWDTETNPSYWCSNSSGGGWAFVDFDAAKAGQLDLPVGLEFDPATETGARLNSWIQNITEGPAVVHAWHGQSWFTNMFEVNGTGVNQFTFGRGGSQGGRNWCRCDQCGYAGRWCKKDKGDQRLISGTWYVENVREELDMPGEFFFYRHNHTLVVLLNETQYTDAIKNGDGMKLVASRLHSLIHINGTSDVKLFNVRFRDAGYTYLEKHGVPSGGDWSLYKGAAVMIENATQVSVRHCYFQRLDGTALLLYGRTRDVSIENNEFAWLGESAMAGWGKTNLWDGSQGDQPRRTIIRRNVVREIGIYEKQSSAWFQAVTMETVLEDNLFFNQPRAAINMNDGFGGGNVIRGNVIFNTCRESGDHGAINTWDRIPYLWDKTHGFISLPTIIEKNVIFANYGASQGVDNDDGSSYYHIQNNLFFNSEGFKMDYGGHDSRFTDNLVITYPYDCQNCFNVADFKQGHEHVFTGNTCVLMEGGRCGETVGTVYSSCEAKAHPIILRNNSYFTVTGNVTIKCGGGKDADVALPLVQEKYAPMEAGSTFGKIPDDKTLENWMVEKILSWKNKNEMKLRLFSAMTQHILTK